MKPDQPVAQCNHVLRVAHCPECGRGVRPVEPRGDTSGRRWDDAFWEWSDLGEWLFSSFGLELRLADGTKWVLYGREWVCIRGPR